MIAEGLQWFEFLCIFFRITAGVLFSGRSSNWDLSLAWFRTSVFLLYTLLAYKIVNESLIVVLWPSQKNWKQFFLLSTVKLWSCQRSEIFNLTWKQPEFLQILLQPLTKVFIQPLGLFSPSYSFFIIESDKKKLTQNN